MESASINFGDFTVYNLDRSYDILLSKYPSLERREFYFGDDQHKLFVLRRQKAREDLKAIEIADKLCESLENVFSYVIGDLSHEHAISIFNFREWKMHKKDNLYK